MNIILIANLSANGQVLLAENPAHAAPQEALGFFIQKINEAGNAVIGRKTFDVLQMFPGGIKALFPTAEIVLLTSNSQTDIREYPTADSPAKALAYLSEKGSQNIIIGGGAATYNAFLEKGLVTEIYFNTIPIIIGGGGILGNVNNINLKYRISESKLLTDEIAQLHLIKL